MKRGSSEFRVQRDSCRRAGNTGLRPVPAPAAGPAHLVTRGSGPCPRRLPGMWARPFWKRVVSHTLSLKLLGCALAAMARVLGTGVALCGAARTGTAAPAPRRTAVASARERAEIGRGTARYFAPGARSRVRERRRLRRARLPAAVGDHARRTSCGGPGEIISPGRGMGAAPPFRAGMSCCRVRQDELPGRIRAGSARSFMRAHPRPDSVLQVIAARWRRRRVQSLSGRCSYPAACAYGV